MCISKYEIHTYDSYAFNVIPRCTSSNTVSIDSKSLSTYEF